MFICLLFVVNFVHFFADVLIVPLLGRCRQGLCAENNSKRRLPAQAHFQFRWHLRHDQT